MSFSENLQAARKKKGYTQEKLAKKVGLATGTIQRYELGTRSPKKGTVAKIADALGLGHGYTKDGEPYFYDFIDTTPQKEYEENQRFNDEQYKNALKGKEYLLNNYNSVNDDGKKRIEDYSSDIAGNPEYRKDCE